MREDRGGAEPRGVGAERQVERTAPFVGVGVSRDRGAMHEAREHCGAEERREWPRRACEPAEARGPGVECGHRNEPKRGDARRRVERDAERDRAAQSVADERGARQREVVHEPTNERRMVHHTGAPALRAVAAAASHEVDDDRAASFGQQRRDGAPRVRRSRESVQQDDRIAATASARGVVVQAGAAHIHELAAHPGKVAYGQTPAQAP